MHVVADRPAIVSALPALTSTCMRRKTHSAWCGSAATPKHRDLDRSRGAGRDAGAGRRGGGGNGRGKAYHSNQVMVEPTDSARIRTSDVDVLSRCRRNRVSRLGAFCQIPELTSRRSDTASIRFSSESHPDLKSAHVTLTWVAPRAFSRSSVRLWGTASFPPGTRYSPLPGDRCIR